MKLNKILIYIFLISTLGACAQGRKSSEIIHDSLTTLTLYYSDKKNEGFDLEKFTTAYDLRYDEFDEKSKKFTPILISYLETNKKDIDSATLTIQEESKYTLSFHANTYTSYIMSTENIGLFFHQNLYILSPNEGTIKRQFYNNSIHSVKTFTGNQSHSQQMYFSNSVLDSAFSLRDGAKYGMEYILEDGIEKVILHDGDSLFFLEINSIKDRQRFSHDPSYFWLFPVLQNYQITINSSSFLHQFVLRFEMEELLNKE